MALWEKTATALSEDLLKGEITPIDVLETCERRVGETEPHINALPTLCFERAYQQAKSLMKDKTNFSKLPLAGIPIAIKDNTEVAGVRTTFGSPIFKDFVPNHSHPLVTKLENAGAIIVGKSNCPEFAAGGSTFNDVFGRTANPWNTKLTSGGSTGGGAAALAAGSLWLAHGTDHAGSLRRPATYCGVVGMRPSPGLVTRGETFGLYSPVSTHGPMARNVEDIALLLNAMAGFCPFDPMTFPCSETLFREAVRTPRLPLRVAFTSNFGGLVPMERETEEAARKALHLLEGLGVEVVEDAPNTDMMDDVFMILRGQEYARDFYELIKKQPEQLKEDIIWNTKQGLAASIDDVAKAERRRASFYQETVRFFQNYDLLITPGASTPAFPIEQKMPQSIDGLPLTNYLGASLITGIPTHMGMPCLSLPTGLDKSGRPLGLQLIGGPRADADLLRFAKAMEMAFGFTGIPRQPNIPS